MNYDTITRTLQAIQAYLCPFMVIQVMLSNWLFVDTKTGLLVLTLTLCFVIPLATLGIGTNLLVTCHDQEIKMFRDVSFPKEVIREVRRKDVSILFWIFIFGFILTFVALSASGIYLRNSSDMFDVVDRKGVLFFSTQVGTATIIAFGTLLMRYIVAAKNFEEARQP